MNNENLKEDNNKANFDSSNNQIDQEAYNKYMESKAYFSKFNAIYDAPITSVDISNSELPIFTEEENIKNVRAAMRRLYGDEIQEDTEENK